MKITLSIIAFLFTASLATAQTTNLTYAWGQTNEPAGTTYVFEYETPGAEVWYSINVGTNLSYTLTGVTYGTTIAATLYATNVASGLGSASEPVITYTVPMPPQPPVLPPGFMIVTNGAGNNIANKTTQ